MTNSTAFGSQFSSKRAGLPMAHSCDIEKFSASDLSYLLQELTQSGVDSWQAAELIGHFLSSRGYGVSNNDARTAASRIEFVNCSVNCMQQELEKLARVM